MNWQEMILKIGKPIWDTRDGSWRILKAYSESKEGKRVTFTDKHEGEKFDTGVFFNEETDTKKASAGRPS